MSYITFEIEKITDKANTVCYYRVYSKAVPADKLAAYYAVPADIIVVGVGETVLMAIENYIELLHKAGIEL